MLNTNCVHNDYGLHQNAWCYYKEKTLIKLMFLKCPAQDWKEPRTIKATALVLFWGAKDQ